MKSKTHRPCRCGCGTEIPYTLNPYATFECKKRDGAVAPSKPRTPIKYSPSSIKRTPLKRNTKPIRKVSEKRAKKDKLYSVLRKLFLADSKNQYCKITGQQTIEVHHTFSGKDRDKYYLDTTTWMAVSRAGHNWIHDNPKEARELGYLK